MRPRQLLAVTSAATFALTTVVMTTAGAAPGTTWVSVGPGGAASEDTSIAPSVSRQGRKVAFQSFDDGLVAGDANGVSDILVRDVPNGTTVRASVDRFGGDSDGASLAPAISANGRYVVFVSEASDLVAGDQNGRSDIFRRDLQTGQTVRIGATIAQGDPTRVMASPSVSGDGSKVAFEVRTGSPTTDIEVYVRNLATGTNSIVARGHDGSSADGINVSPTISADGRFVALISAAENLVLTDGNGLADVYRIRLSNHSATLVSRATDGGAGDSDAFGGAPGISADGRFVVFHSEASDLVSDDENGEPDVFRRDIANGTTTRVSVTSDEEEVSGFGSFHTVRMGVSDSGRYVVYSSDFSGLAANDTNGQPDVFVRDVWQTTTRLVSAGPTGVALSGFSTNPAISGDGRFVVLQSEAGLTEADDNVYDDIYRRRLSSVQ